MTFVHLSEYCKPSDDPAAATNLFQYLQRSHDATSEAHWINYTEEGRTSLHWALTLRNIPLALMLLQHDGEHRTQLVSQHPCQNFDEILKAVRVDTIDDEGSSTVYSACSATVPNEILRLMLTKCPPDFVNHIVPSSGNTALIAAASRGNLDAFKMLLAAGGDPTIINSHGQTALHRAVNKGNADLVEEVIASVRKQQVSETSLVRFLNVQDSNGDTALHYAGMENNQEIGQILLRAGADRTRRNKQGKEFWEV